ncbi:MxaD protein, putative [Methylocella silvestris BL2]|uniref:MxaD protein, putative n=1 Tax=Methylocella silvestris (strain DSM 15510 / CIP 108128 / LMG 27833 / NCIMB 13906 / BL2) TaxID=395965 RepID=B8EJQ0_METSB|nr:SRPBCC family protein [Methylocella silvestris]ACK49454.1 MxaD protein, putative [Methylocella silvestris BL2]
MKHFFSIVAFLLFATAAAAHGPTPQKAEETIAIAASPNAVWAIVADFGAISSWHPLIAESQSTDGNKAGATRKLTLKKGGVLTEDLDEYDAPGMSYSYRVEDPNLDALAVSFYSATLSVKPAADGGSTVEWFGRFYRGDTGNFPPEDLNDEAAQKSMSEFMKAGLAGLKAKAEAKP